MNKQKIFNKQDTLGLPLIYKKIEKEKIFKICNTIKVKNYDTRKCKIIFSCKQISKPFDFLLNSQET